MTSFRWKLAYQMPLLISLRSGIKWRGSLWGETGFVMEADTSHCHKRIYH
ncbi:MAG: hypothetical protein HDR57_04075 [Treponema sp.]|nr:hypothetical protein [Treponema sp.]